MDLTQFREELTAKMPNIEGANARPFVCEGSPLDCKVFIVGINPATQMEGDFWDFWSDDTGFEYAKWKEVYKTSGKNETSQTRKRINMITDILETRKIKVLQTNIYAFPTKDKDTLDEQAKENQKYKDTSIFEYLLETSKYPVLWIHGGDAIKAFAKISKIPHKNISKITKKMIAEGQYVVNRTKINEKPIVFLATNHLSNRGGFSDQEIESITNTIKISFMI